MYSPSRKFGEQDATVFYCGDDTEAKQIIAGLLREIEVEPIDAGSLKNARFIEPAMMLLVQLAYGEKMGGEIGFKLLRR